MGVLACYRNGCENIMCDYYSPEFGYICWECIKELKAKGECNVQAFMDSPKKASQEINNWEDYVDNIFMRGTDETD